MAAGSHLLLRHLEGVSWQILQAYPDAVRDLIRRRAGLYALYRRDKLYYVGLASDLMWRIRRHLKDRHNGKWDRFSVYLTMRHEHMKELESLLLRIVKPKGNALSGAFSRSESLTRRLQKSMRELDADRRARLLGGRVATQRARFKATRSKGQARLAGISDRSTPLRARYRGRTLRASLRPNGSIRFKRRTFRSPSAAARAAVGHACNGWAFWLYRDSRGRWVQLRALKR